MKLLPCLVVSIASVLLGSACTTAAPPPGAPVAADGVEAADTVASAEFGLFNDDESGQPVFVPTRSVPLVEGQSYGWIVSLPNSAPGKKVRWREEFVLPAAPSTWGEADPDVRQRISSDGRTSVKEAEVVVPEDGRIANAWSVAPGDPAGRYVIRVFVDGQKVRTFEFDLK